jgi:hypothetical protein
LAPRRARATAQAIRDALEAVKLAEEVGLEPDRIEAVAGRGSSNITFSLFDLDERDYDMLFSCKQYGRAYRDAWAQAGLRHSASSGIAAPKLSSECPAARGVAMA